MFLNSSSISAITWDRDRSSVSIRSMVICMWPDG
jgi:hypothetical protein